jgi:hypothetical protein
MGGSSGQKTKKLRNQADYQFGLETKAQEQNLAANRVNQQGPWGSTNWSQDPAGQWTQTTTLDPAEQQRLDQQRGLTTGLGGVAQGLVGQVGQQIQNPLDYSGFAQGPSGAPGGPQFGQVGTGPQFNSNFGTVDPNDLMNSGTATGGNFGGANAREIALQDQIDMGGISAMPEASEAARQQVIDAMYGQASSRMNPEFEQQQRQQLDRLYAMGGREGDQFFNEQQGNLGRQQTDARQQALWNAIQGGGEEQSRLFGLGMANRQQGFNEAMGRGQFTNESRMNQFGQGLSNAQMRNQAGIASAGNATSASIANAQNRQRGLLAGLDFNRQGVQMGNELAQQGFQNQMAGTEFNNQAGQQSFQNQMASNAEQSRIRDAQIQEALQQRGMPMAEMGSVLGMMGNVQNPQFSDYYTAQAGAPDYMGLYGQNLAAKAAGGAGMMSGLGQIGGMLGSAAISKSDRRLKSNIVLLGKTPGGHNWYEYDIGGRRERGVMAQEVPHAAIMDADGFYSVDYSKVT